MFSLGDDISYDEKWTPLSIDMESVKKILKECETRHDVQDASVAASLSTRLLIVADHLNNDLTRLKLFFTITRTKAKDRLNDVANGAIDAKSDAAKQRIGEADTQFRQLRDEYKKAELLVGHLELKYRQLLAHHYDFRDTARRLSGIGFAGGSGSDSDVHENFTAQLPLAEESKDKKEETF